MVVLFVRVWLVLLGGDWLACVCQTPTTSAASRSSVGKEVISGKLYHKLQ